MDQDQQHDDFNSDAFFNDGSLQQMDPSAGIDALGSVPLPVNPLLVERLLTLHYSGCLNSVAWSRQGHVTSISEDGKSVVFQCLMLDPIKRSWQLSPKHVEKVGNETLVSVCWSPMASDLAVVDVLGRLSILRPQKTAMNRYSLVWQGVADGSNDLTQAIGMHWLGQERPDQPRNIVQNASRNEVKWVHNHARGMPHGPLFQRAVIVVDRKAQLSITYEHPTADQTMDLRYSTATTQLATVEGTIFTHAAYAPTSEGKLLVALHSDTGSVAAYFVRIGFPDFKQNPEAPPTFSIETGIASLPFINSDSMMSSHVFDPESQYLTHLGIIPTTDVEQTKAVHFPPTVYAVYSNINKSAASTDAGFLMSSTIRRWTIITLEDTLHPRFNELPAKALPDPTPKPAYSCQQQPDKDDQVITTATLHDPAQGVFIQTHDGRTDFLSLEDLSSISYQANTNEASSLFQSGFAFPINNPQSCLALSPNGCLQVNMNFDNTISFTSMDFSSLTQQPNTVDNPNTEAAIAAVVLTFARACWTNGNMDDLMACITSAFPSTHAHALTSALYRTLFRETEFLHERTSGSELDKVVQKPVLTKVFAFHYALSFLSLKDSPPNAPMPLSGQWVWIASNLRFVAQLLYVSIREVQNPQTPPHQELVDMVCGNIKWTLDLLRYMIAYILEVGDREANPDFFDTPAPGESVDGSQGLVALILNCHWSRQFLVAIVRAMRVLTKAQEPRTQAQSQIALTIARYSSKKGVNLMAAEGLLDAGWSGVGDQGVDGGEVSGRQIEMMSSGVVPEAYTGTVKRVLEKLFNRRSGGMRERGAIEREKLWVDRVDLGWVLLNETEGEESRVYDVYKKKVIVRGRKGAEGEELLVKRCVRCGRYCEDVNGPAKELPRHMLQLMTKCVCDGLWMVQG